MKLRPVVVIWIWIAVACLLTSAAVIGGLTFLRILAEPGTRGYLLRSTHSGFEVGYRLCPSQRLTEVSVTSLDTGKKIWEIGNPSGLPGGFFRPAVGSNPSGTVVPFNGWPAGRIQIDWEELRGRHETLVVDPLQMHPGTFAPAGTSDIRPQSELHKSGIECG